MKVITNIHLFIVLVFPGTNLRAQRTYWLPNDPPGLDQGYTLNWLKKSSETAMKNEYSIAYEDFYSFATHFFLEHSDKLEEIGKSRTSSNLAFDWAKPYIREWVNGLEEADRILLYLSLKKTKSYLEKFDFAYENKYLATASTLFAWHNPADYFDSEWKYPYPNEISHDFRDFESFMFRRIRNGVDKSTMERFVTEIISLINVNFSKKVVKTNELGNPLIEFYWDRVSFTGDYRRYAEYSRWSPSPNDKRTFLKAIGSYKDGNRTGVWRFFTLSSEPQPIPSGAREQTRTYMQTVKIDFEVEYANDKPIRLKKYYEDEASDYAGVKSIYNTVMELDVQLKNLKATVYDGKKIIQTYDSDDDFIEYWDLYDTQRRIIRNLSNPNLDEQIKRTFSINDKPKVERNPQTNNYKLYDELGRKGKDHALLIATNLYTNNYDYECLKNPIRDAEAIADNLKNYYGFDCEIVRNPTRKELLNVLDKYQKRHFDSTEQLLVFISGHGMYDDNLKDGYIVPKDGKPLDEDQSRVSLVSYTELGGIINKFQCRHTLLMVDACFSGALQDAVAKFKSPIDTIGRKMQGAKMWFLNKIRFQTKMYITSSAADRMSSDGINHSPFAGMFIRALQDIKIRDEYILDIEDIYAMLSKLIPSPQKNIFPGHERESDFFFVMQ